MCVEEFPESCNESLELLLAFDFLSPTQELVVVVVPGRKGKSNH